MIPAGIRAIAVALPEDIRTNEYYINSNPKIAEAHRRWLQKRKVTARSPASTGAPLNDRLLFDRAMAPHLDDPFHGARLRRILPPGQPSALLAVRAARQVLEIADVAVDEIDLLIATAMYSDKVGLNDAAYVARELSGYQGGAINLDATCAGGLAALVTALAHVRAGMARNVLVISTTHFSSAIDEDDPMALMTGDGASAILVGPVMPGYGLLATKALHTGNTCGAWLPRAVSDPNSGKSSRGSIRLSTTPNTMNAIRSTMGPMLRRCTSGALQSANLQQKDLDFYVFGMQLAWNAQYMAQLLEVPAERTIDIYPWYAGLGSSTVPVGIHHAAYFKKLRPGHLLLLYVFGGEAESVAVILRWSETRLGPLPTGVPSDLSAFETNQDDTDGNKTTH